MVKQLSHRIRPEGGYQPRVRAKSAEECGDLAVDKIASPLYRERCAKPAENDGQSKQWRQSDEVHHGARLTHAAA